MTFSTERRAEVRPVNAVRLSQFTTRNSTPSTKDPEDCDLTTSIPFTAKKSHILLTEKARISTKDLLDGLRRVGLNLISVRTERAGSLSTSLVVAGLRRVGFNSDFGEDGTGWQFKYLTRAAAITLLKVGCSDLIV